MPTKFYDRPIPPFQPYPNTRAEIVAISIRCPIISSVEGGLT